VQLFTGILEYHVPVATATAVKALGVVECFREESERVNALLVVCVVIR
jgi:hypothetical protein